MLAFTRLSLARQFMLASFVILFGGMFIIGNWMARQIEQAVVDRTAAVTALYVDSFIAPHLQNLQDDSRLTAEGIASLESLLMNTPLGQEIVAFKIWNPDGRILYSTNSALIGQTFPIRHQFQLAFAGEIHAEISELTASENEYEHGIWPRLIETYAPVRLQGTNEIIAISEFYQKTDKLDQSVRAAQFGGWLIVGAASLTMYLLLTGLVGRASNTILSQQNELREKVAQLSELLTQNELLHNRVTLAASRATSLNEQLLARISADLHDGPGQDLGFALLRIEELAETCAACNAAVNHGPAMNDDFNAIQSALRSAMAEMRAILSGLRLPEIKSFTLGETVERAVRDFEQKTGSAVNLAIQNGSANAPLSVKIAIYRLLQESLANGFKHAPGASQQVKIVGTESELLAEINDNGGGFDPTATPEEGRLGLIGMRERVEILGGTFEIKSAPHRGTLIRAQLPFNRLEMNND
ncbi:MAG: sensor histidine kinase [Chloroflexi bacterium]|nr:sensor histidine kinase [Chloroflexota bacterium]